MSAFAARLGFIVVLGCGGAATPDSDVPDRDVPDEPEDDTPEKLVGVALIADVSSVAPGQEFNIAVRLDIEPTWHIYWLNPGESGLPTEVSFSAPAEFSIGDVRYPGPKRFEDPGGVVSYGYEELALVSAAAVAPESLEPGAKIELFAETSWLACREACIRGSAKSRLLLGVAGPEAPSAPAHESMWSAHRDQLPREIAELDKAVTRWEGLTMIIEVPDVERAQYFPSPAEQAVLSGQAAIPSESGTTLRVSYKKLEGTATPESSTGLLRVESDPARYFRIDVPWPQES